MNALYEDNKGADILEIIDHENGKYTFQVGNCCVFILRKTGTISEITQWFLELMVELPQDIKWKAIE